MASELANVGKSSRYITPTWPAPEGVKAFVTTRRGGVSIGAYQSFNMGLNSGDNKESVLLNRKQLTTDWNWKEPVLWVKQIHGTRLVSAVNMMDDQVIEADGVWSNSPGAVCLVLTADCMPVFLCSKTCQCVAAVHVGWRGLAAGVLESAISTLPEKPDNLLAWMGPTITKKYFEVGPEVRNAFLNNNPDVQKAFKQGKEDRWYADLVYLARNQLQSLGVSNIYGGEYCTWQNETLFYSYRRDGKASGRMAAAIWIQD